MAKFVLLLRSQPVDYSAWSPEDLQQLIEKFNNWAPATESKPSKAKTRC